MTIGPHQPPGMIRRRVVAVDDGDLVAVAHRAQDGQKLRPQRGGIPISMLASLSEGATSRVRPHLQPDRSAADWPGKRRSVNNKSE